jgi:hypothetical protein
MFNKVELQFLGNGLMDTMIRNGERIEKAKPGSPYAKACEEQNKFLRVLLDKVHSEYDNSK